MITYPIKKVGYLILLLQPLDLKPKTQEQESWHMTLVQMKDTYNFQSKMWSNSIS